MLNKKKLAVGSKIVVVKPSSMEEELIGWKDRAEVAEAELERRIAVFSESNNLHAAFCNQKRAEVAEAEVVRLREALEAFVDPPLKGHEQLAILNARKALEPKP